MLKFFFRSLDRSASRKPSLCKETVVTSSHLIIVVMAMEKRLLSEYHTSQHATQAPHIQAVIIHLYKSRRTIQLLMNSVEQTPNTNRFPPPSSHTNATRLCWGRTETPPAPDPCSAQCSSYSNWDTAISKTSACFYFHCRLRCYESLRNVLRRAVSQATKGGDSTRYMGR